MKGLNPKILAHVALFTVALIYGANYTIAKEVLNNNYLQPLGFILLRVACGALLFWVFHTLFIKEKVERADLKMLFLCGLTGIAVNQMMFFVGLKYTRPINAALIMTTVPMVVIVMAAVMGEEGFTSRKLLGIVIGASGAILLILRGNGLSVGADTWLGDLCIFINACSYAIYLVLVKKMMKKYNPFTVLKWVFTFGLMVVIPFGVPQLDGVDWAGFPTSIWIAIAYVLLFTTFVAYLFNAYALSIITPSVAGAYVYLQPLLATLIALSLGKDQLSMIKIVAGALIFVGVFLVTQRR